MHRTCRAAVGIAARSIVPDSSRARCKPDLERVEEHTVGIAWINNHSLAVPVVGIVALPASAGPERPGLRSLDKRPGAAAIRRTPGPYLAARCAATTPVMVTDSGL